MASSGRGDLTIRRPPRHSDAGAGGAATKVAKETVDVEERPPVPVLLRPGSVDLPQLAMRQLTLACAGVVLVVVDNELVWWSNFPDYVAINSNCRASGGSCGESPLFPITRNMDLVNAVRIVNCVVTLALISAVYRYQRHAFDTSKFKNQIPPTLPFWRSDMGQVFMREVVLNLLFPWPYMENYTSNSTTTWYILAHALPWLRGFYVVRWMYHTCGLNTPGGRFVATLTGIKFDYAFMIKTYLDGSPFAWCGVVLATDMILMTYLLRVSDTVACSQDPTLQCQALSYRDAAWTLILTVSTVGYGTPFVPYTLPGRICVLIVGFSGVLMTAVIVASLYTGFQGTMDEARLEMFMDRQSLYNRTKNSAARAIQAMFRYSYHYRSSVLWHKGMGGIAYRQVSTRLPHEKASLEAIGDWKATRRARARQHVNTDPVLYASTLSSTLNVKLTDIRDAMQTLWDMILPPEQRGDFEERLAQGMAPAAAGAALRASQLSLQGFIGDGGSHELKLTPAAEAAGIKGGMAVFAPRAPASAPPGSRPVSGGSSLNADDAMESLFPDPKRAARVSASAEDIIADATAELEALASPDTPVGVPGGFTLSGAAGLAGERGSPAPSTGSDADSSAHDKMNVGELQRARVARRRGSFTAHSQPPAWVRELTDALRESTQHLESVTKDVNAASNALRMDRGAAVVADSTKPKELQMATEPEDDVWM